MRDYEECIHCKFCNDKGVNITPDYTVVQYFYAGEGFPNQIIVRDNNHEGYELYQKVISNKK